jgi:glycosyltransferase involved in cell wall biosynthesis
VRLLLIGPGHPFRGGIAYFTHGLADALETGWQDRTIWASFSRQYPRLLFPGGSDRQEESYLRGLRPPDLRWDPWNPASALALAERAAAEGVDAVLLPWWTWFWAAADLWLVGALRRAGVRRFVAIVHNPCDHEGAIWKRFLSRTVLGRFDAFLAHSQAIAEPLRRDFPGKPVGVANLPTHLLPGDPGKPSGEARRALGLPPTGPVFLFFGIVRPYKGLDLLLDAWPAIERETGGQLVVAGEFWPGTEKLRERIRSRVAAGASIRLHDRFVPDSEVVDFFRAADLVVLPYRSATGSGIVPIARWSGKPVLGSDLPGLRDVVDPEVDGLLVPPGNADALAAEAIRFVREGLGDRLADGSRLAAARLGWQPYVSILKNLVESV